MIPASHQSPTRAAPRQMRGVQPPDGTAPDDADAFHSLELRSPLYFHDVVRPANLSLERSEQAVGIVERVANKDSFVEQSILQGGRDRMDGRGPALSHSLGATVAVRRRRFDMAVFH